MDLPAAWPGSSARRGAEKPSGSQRRRAASVSDAACSAGLSAAGGADAPGRHRATPRHHRAGRRGNRGRGAERPLDSGPGGTRGRPSVALSADAVERQACRGRDLHHSDLPAPAIGVLECGSLFLLFGLARRKTGGTLRGKRTGRLARPFSSSANRGYQRKTMPVEMRALFCVSRLPPTVSWKRVSRYSAWTSRRPICWVALTSTPPPAVIANAFAEVGLEMALEPSCAPPNSTWANGVTRPTGWA